jgi:hypothetical protein
MAIYTTRAKSYGFAETAAAVLSNASTGDDGLTKDGAPDLFMGPVLLTSLSVVFNKSGGAADAAHLKVYDAAWPWDQDVVGGLKEPLWIIQLWDGEPILLTFPDGFAFSTGFTARATVEPGTGSIGADTNPEGTVNLRLVGRQS